MQQHSSRAIQTREIWVSIGLRCGGMLCIPDMRSDDAGWGIDTKRQAATAAASSRSQQSQQRPVAATRSRSSSSVRVRISIPKKCALILFLRMSTVGTAAQEAMTGRRRHGRSFVRTTTTAYDDDESKRVTLSLLLTMP